MQRIKVVLLGLGHMGAFHFRVLREDDRFEVVAIVDPVLKALPPGSPSIPLLRKLEQAAHLEFQLAVIAAPTELHFALVEQALKMGKHVFVEKPAAADEAQAQHLVQLAKQQSVCLAVGHVERCNPVVGALQKLVRSGLLGRIVHVNALRAGGWPRHVKPGNDVILDLAVHELDVFRLLLGPLRITHSVAHSSREPGILDTAEISLVNAEGTSACIHVNWLTPQRIRTIRVTGTQAVAHLDYLAQSLELVGTNLSALQGFAQLGQQSSKDAQGLERVQLPVENRESLKIQLSQLFEYISGRPHHLAHGDELIESVALIEQAQRRARLDVREPMFSIKDLLDSGVSTVVIPNA